jgi:hypothetical protein
MGSYKDRLEVALAADAPFDALLATATQLRDEGITQEELRALLDDLRADRESDADETRYNAVLDVLDFVVGWCPPGSTLFPLRQPQ